jgi:hypothetical protein
MRSYEILNEVNMSPSALKSFMTTPIVKNMFVGFEAEILVPGLQDLAGAYVGLDLSRDMPTPSGPDWINEIKAWLAGGNRSDSPAVINSAITKITRDLEDFSDRKFSNHLWTDAGAEDIAFRLGKALNTADKDTITNNIDNNSEIYKKVKQEMKDDLFNPKDMFPKFLNHYRMYTMENVCDRYYLTWPYIKNYTSTMSLNELEHNFREYTGFRVTSSTQYHTADREPDLWIFEPDGSLTDDSLDASGIELISPPMPIMQALESINKFWDWTKTLKIRTNNTCGFHIGISIENIPTQKLDIVKLALFLGDNYVLKIFGRLDNQYTKSALDAITRNVRGYDVNNYIKAFKQGINKIAYQSIIQSMTSAVDEKYMTIRLHSKYIEFRSAGGNYLENKTTIENTLIRYIKAMAIAADPEAEKEEYVKKIYKLLSSRQASQSKDTIHLFAQYTAGEITLRDLKELLLSVHSGREGPNVAKSVKTAKEEERRYQEKRDAERAERLSRERSANDDVWNRPRPRYNDYNQDYPSDRYR